jgi:hypothetical protein
MLLSQPAAAQSVDQDVRCMILSNGFKNAAKEPAQKKAAEVASIYYTGRVAARVPTNELKSKYVAQIAQLTGLQGLQTGPLMNACFQQLQAQERAMNAVGQEVAQSLTKDATKK